MPSVVSICNLALSNIGKDNVTSLSEASAEARACNQFYEHVRDTLLQAYPWRFAGKTRALALATNTRPGTWAYAYDRPNDCLKIRWVRGEYLETDPSPQSLQEEISNRYDLEAGLIFCDIENAHLRYTQRVTNAELFPPLFVEALSWHLAVRLSMPLTRDPKVRADAYQLASATTGQAQMADANEFRETSDHETEFVVDRDFAGIVAGFVTSDV